MSVLYEQSAVVVRPAVTTDRYGNKKYDYGAAATRIAVDQLNIQPDGDSEEETSGKQVSVTTWLLISAPGTMPDFRATDRLEYDGMELEVIGRVGRWPVPTSIRHIQAQLKEVD